MRIWNQRNGNYYIKYKLYHILLDFTILCYTLLHSILLYYTLLYYTNFSYSGLHNSCASPLLSAFAYDSSPAFGGTGLPLSEALVHTCSLFCQTLSRSLDVQSANWQTYTSIQYVYMSIQTHGSCCNLGVLVVVVPTIYSPTIWGLC